MAGNAGKSFRLARKSRLVPGILAGAAALAALGLAVAGAPHATASAHGEAAHAPRHSTPSQPHTVPAQRLTAPAWGPAGSPLGSARPQAGSTKALLIDEGSTDYDWATVAPRYGAIILNAWNYRWIPAIKRANPSAEVLEYKDLSSSRPSACRQSDHGRVNSELPTGVDYCWAMTHHPGWFLRSSGRLLHYPGFPGSFEMDYGNPGYQHQWASNVTTDLTAHGWDGVFADNAVTSTGYGVTARYPDDRAVQAAMGRMIRVVGTRIKKAGKLFIPNVGGDVGAPSVWVRWLPGTSGEFDEFTWSFPGGGVDESTADWRIWESELRSCSARRLRCLFHVGAYTEQPANVVDFALASYLLYANTRSALGIGAGLYSHYPQLSRHLGTPAGPARQPRLDVWQRDFADGTVTVNLHTWTGTISAHRHRQ